MQVNGTCSASHVLECGVPQGSVLGPLLYSMYTSPRGKIARRHQMFYHFYADDTQLYITFRMSSVPDMNLSNTKLVNCVWDMDAWMLSNKLKLNKDKSKVLVISSCYRPRPPLSSVDICNETISCSPSACNIGVIFDQSLCNWYLMSMLSVSRPFSIFVILVSYANILLMMLQRSLFMPS